MTTIHYQHRQSTGAFVWLVVAVLIAVGIPVVLAGSLASAVPLIVAGPVIVVVVLGSSRLETTVTDDHVRAEFRFGWPARTIRRSTIVESRAVRNRWWYGFGIRRVPSGWMYNVWGLDAVEIDYTRERGGRRSFRIGTDDPDGLAAAIGGITRAK